MKSDRKTIFITGVNKGIGAGLAKRFAESGHYVIGTVRKQQALKGLNKTYQLDLTNNKSIAEVSELLKEESTRIDLLINNAGIGSDHDETLSEADNFELRFRTHLFGTYYFTESILPFINNGGMIANISSKLASFEEVGLIDKEKLTSTKMAYIISKSSLNMYTKLLATRLKERAIAVLAIHPGWVKTTLSETNKNAPLSIPESVDGIIKLFEDNKASGTFWDAESQKELGW